MIMIIKKMNILINMNRNKETKRKMNWTMYN